jgi:glutamyl-tRNA reductase
VKLATSQHIENFLLIGTNFNKADTQTRSRFAITKSQAEEVYKNAAKAGIKDFLILSTCNRTEYYSTCNANDLRALIANQLHLSQADLDTYFYYQSGKSAVEHFFRVVSGLDSQIIGDYEIVCQVKAALEEARKHNLVGTIMDRVSNFAFQASKRVKTHTNLSSGKYSVSYAAAELLFYESAQHKIDTILLVGTGDFGSTVARNLSHYFPQTKITLSNRTREKADKLAQSIKANVLPFNQFQQHIDDFDAIITTVGIERYLVNKEHIRSNRVKLFLDLSVPQAVNPELKLIPGIKLFSVDEVSAFHNRILHERMLEVPRAEKIVNMYIDRLLEWHQVYNYRDVILAYREKVQNLANDSLATQNDVWALNQQKKIDKTFSGIIQQIRAEGYAGCMMIEAITTLVPAEK